VDIIPRLRSLCAAALACACLPIASAGADQSVVLHTSFSPNRLGASTTVGFGFDISSTSGGLPSPLRGVDLHLPAGINYVTTTLGLAICQPSALVAHGLAGCSPNSRLGFGSARAVVPFGLGASYEIPNIQALMGPPQNGNIVVLFYADGREPVYAQLVFQGELLTGSGSLGGSLDTAIPLIPSVTSGAPVSIINVRSTIGPSHLTYYRRVHGRTISFHPRGVTVPERCPRGGFQFSALFTFMDGTSTVAKNTVPCPRRG
jgi:hypothetical protein